MEWFPKNVIIWEIDSLFQSTHSGCTRPKELAWQAQDFLLHWYCKN